MTVRLQDFFDLPFEFTVTLEGFALFENEQ